MINDSNMPVTLAAYGSLFMTIWLAITRWLDSRSDREFKQRLELACKDREATREQWEEDDKKHKRHMQELAVTASLSAKNLELVISQSKAERADQIRELDRKLTDKIDENTKVSVEAFKEANGVNAKLVALGESRLDAAVNAKEP